MELLPAIHRIDGVSSNAYLIIEPEGLTVIDTGLPGLGNAARIFAYVRKLGRDPRELRRILLTHQHPDHVGSAATLAAATGATVVAHPKDAPAIAGKAPRELPHGVLRPVFLAMIPLLLKPALVSQQVRGGETLPVLVAEGGLQVIETPGHTTGHISFHLPGRKLLFVGDAVMHRGERIIASPAIFNTDDAQARRTVQMLAQDFEIAASLPGHGKPILSGAGVRLAETASKL